MTIWSAEVKDLEKLYNSFKGRHTKLDKELDRLIKTDDENMVLVYSRRCLEVIITDLCECELKRPRGTEPLKRIIDKLNKEEIVPHNIIVSMQNLNSLSTFGAHPKDFDPVQVKTVLLDLTTTLKWHLKYFETLATTVTEPGGPEETRKEPAGVKKGTATPKKRILLASAIVIVCAVIVVALILTDVIKGGKGIKAGNIKSLVVLPFDNITGNDSIDHILLGMHNSLIQNMQRVSGWSIKCKTTAQAIRDAKMTTSDIASQLNVDALIEPVLECYGDSICMNYSFVRIRPEEDYLFTGRFCEEMSQILNLNNKITKQVADNIMLELTPDEERLLAESMVVDPEAYDAFQKGNYYWEQLHPDSLRKGMECYQLAIEKDPDWAPPYAGMAGAWHLQGFGGLIPWNQALPKVYQYLNRALELDPNSAYAHYVAAGVAVWAEWDWEKGEEEFLKSLELNPNDALCHLYYAHLLMSLRRFEEAVLQADLGKELDPLEPLALTLHGVVMWDAGDCESAISDLKKALSVNPDFGYARNTLEGYYFDCGQYEEWIAWWRQVVCWNEEIQDTIEEVLHKQGHIAAIEKLIMINYAYGKPGCQMDDFTKVLRYLQVKDYDKALDYLEKVFEASSSSLPYIATNSFRYEELKVYPRYIELLKKMNLPLPETD